MKLIKISLENVRSYDREEIKFPSGATLLAGDVGSGKTTILMALEFAFFGLQPGQRGASLVANSKDEASITLECEVNETQVIIERKLKRTTKGVNQEYSAITINGVKEEVSVSELKLKILLLLGYPEEFLKKTNLLYRYTVYSPQEEMKQIIMDDPESRLDSLRHIFGIDKYRKIKENLAKAALHIRENTKVYQGEIKDSESLKSKLQDSLGFVHVLESSLENLSHKKIIKREMRQGVENELKRIQDSILEKQKFDKESEKANLLLRSKLQYLSESQSQLTALERSIEQKVSFNPQHLVEINKAIVQNLSKIDVFNNNLIEHRAKMASLLARKKEAETKDARVSELEFCPTCLQSVSTNHKHAIKYETEHINNEIHKELQELKKSQNYLEQELILVKKEGELLLQSKLDLEIAKSKEEQRLIDDKKLKSLRKEVESVQKDVKSLEEHLTNLKKELLNFAKYENQKRIKEEELKKAFLEEKNEEIKFAELKREKEIRLAEMESLRLEIKRKEIVREKMNRLIELESWLSQDFNGLVTFLERNILLKLRQEFSKLFNNWFKMLTSENFFAHLDENFTPIILQGNYETDYDFLSGGERTAVALAYRLALNQIIGKVYSAIRTKDLLILDEPTDGFSEQQLDKIREIIPELDVKQLIIVSHEPKIEGFVDTIIRVKKQGGVSVIA